eukprot:6662646-Heterocapsa_arctica.AAC.1
MCPSAGVASFRSFSPPCPPILVPAREGPGMHPRSVPVSWGQAGPAQAGGRPPVQPRSQPGTAP